MEKNLVMSGLYLEAFSVPISIVDLNVYDDMNELNNALCEDIKNIMATDRSQNRTFKGNAFQSKLSLESKYESFEELRLRLNEAVKQPLLRYGVPTGVIEKNVLLYGLWFNAIDGNGFSMPHTHTSKGTALWTGSYYPMGEDVNIEDMICTRSDGMYSPGNLIIEDNNFSIKDALSFEKLENVSNSSRLGVRPKKGAVVFFPAWLQHWVYPVVNEVRYSISFTVTKNL